MKATGIVRRIDDLGRIVIPKEIRRTLKIREEDVRLVHLVRRRRACIGMDRTEGQPQEKSKREFLHSDSRV